MPGLEPAWLGGPLSAVGLWLFLLLKAALLIHRENAQATTTDVPPGRTEPTFSRLQHLYVQQAAGLQLSSFLGCASSSTAPSWQALVSMTLVRPMTRVSMTQVVMTLVRPGSLAHTLAIHSPGLYTRLRTTRQKGTATEPSTPLLPHHLLPRRAWLTARYPRLCGAGSRGSINWEDVGRRSKNPSCWQAFVTGGAAEAEAFFRNKGEPVHCLSTRFEGVNYRASMLIGMASVVSKRYIATYNPNFYNQFTKRVGAETDEQRKRRTDGRWLRSFWKALEHTKRTGGCLIQVGCALALEPCVGLCCWIEDPARGLTLACLCWPFGSRCRQATRTGSTATCRWRRG